MHRLSSLLQSAGRQPRTFLLALIATFALAAFSTDVSARTFVLTGSFSKAQVKKACGGDYVEAGGKYGCSKPCKGGTCAVGCEKGKCNGKVPNSAMVAATPGQRVVNTVDSTLGGTAVARMSGGGPGGLGFSCNEPDNPGRCSCDGPKDSQDCKDMAKNCDGDISCGWLVDNCTCKHKPASMIGQQIKNLRVPTGGLLNDRGTSTGGGPAPTGSPVAPTAPPVQKIN